MKRLMLIALLGGLSLTAAAQTTPDSSVRIRGYQIELPAHPHILFAGDFDTYKGVYDMANGDTLVMRQVGRRMYAEMGDGQRRELVAAASNVFVARDQNVKITLNQQPDGDITGNVLMVVGGTSPQQASAQQVISLVGVR